MSLVFTDKVASVEVLDAFLVDKGVDPGFISRMVNALTPLVQEYEPEGREREWPHLLEAGFMDPESLGRAIVGATGVDLPIVLVPLADVECPPNWVAEDFRPLIQGMSRLALDASLGAPLYGMLGHDPEAQVDGDPHGIVRMLETAFATHIWHSDDTGQPLMTDGNVVGFLRGLIVQRLLEDGNAGAINEASGSSLADSAWALIRKVLIEAVEGRCEEAEKTCTLLKFWMTNWVWGRSSEDVGIGRGMIVFAGETHPARLVSV
ncbi:hypothetical protein CL629_01035 [bacterium]|nr:hypothetical protein [bacterium]|tara:strand:+ start:1010 stop:1798 length:789 start_codon:yes stop_codon:yes gene_type:complete